MPPPADQIAPRIFLGPALRAQPDRRLVALVREGYEVAFEEIVRRYRRPLDRFAAAIVGARSEDVTQDALSKALLALRGSEAEIELRPWLYRIVRNTALNELRDRPPDAEQPLDEAIPGGLSAAAAAERREEMRELMGRLQALPEPQRAAIVMRELEGLSHEEIAASLGVSGGAARQAIYRAREALRNGLGLLIPLPLLRALLHHGAEVATGAGAGAAVATGAGLASGGGALGGLGAGGAIKVGVATALVAGSVGAGAVVVQERGGDAGTEPAVAASAAVAAQASTPTAGATAPPPSPTPGLRESRPSEVGGPSRQGRDRNGDRGGEDRGVRRGGDDGADARRGGRRASRRDGRHRHDGPGGGRGPRQEREGNGRHHEGGHARGTGGRQGRGGGGSGPRGESPPPPPPLPPSPEEEGDGDLLPPPAETGGGTGDDRGGETEP